MKYSFTTELGRIAIDVTERGLRRVVWGGAGGSSDTAPATREWAARIQAVARGERVACDDIPLDIDASPFTRRVYEIVRRIPAGRTRTYGEVARLAGSPGAARAVGACMARNPVPLVVPCHRVVAATGKGGFSAPGGLRTKLAMLAREACAAT